MKHLEGLHAFIKTNKGASKGVIKRAYKHRLCIEIDGIQHGYSMKSITSLKVCFKNGIVEYI